MLGCHANRNKPEIENPKIIHYNLFDKPWCYDDIQYQDYFWEYAKQSVYYDKIKAYNGCLYGQAEGR